jgi:hypothetical protein
MPDSLSKQVADALIARCAAISGIGDTDIEPRKLGSVGAFPCVFIEGDEEDKSPRTRAGSASEKTCVLTVTLAAYTNDSAPLVALYALCKAIEDAVEAAPINLNVEGVMHTFCEGGKRFRVSEDNRIYGYGTVRVAVTYNQTYGSA